MARRDRDEQGAYVVEVALVPGKTRPEPSKDDLYEIEDPPEFVLVPLLATDPLPYLVDLNGKPLDAAGARIGTAHAQSISPAVRRFQKQATSHVRGKGSP